MATRTEILKRLTALRVEKETLSDKINALIQKGNEKEDGIYILRKRLAEVIREIEDFEMKFKLALE